MPRVQRTSGVGKVRPDNQSFISGLTDYRLAIDTADATGVTGVEAITGSMDCSNSDYAAEMLLMLFVKSSRESGLQTASLEIWVSPESASGPWYLLQELNVTLGAQVFRITNAPPGYYKVVLLDKSAAEVDIYYQFRS